MVRDNCVFNEDHPDQLFGGYGYVGGETDNIVADPLCVDAGDNDFSLQPDSPCAGKGPNADIGEDEGAGDSDSTDDAIDGDPEVVSLTILNVDENDEPLINSCFQIYEEGIDIFAATPLANLCDAQDEDVDAQVTFELEPGTYILHQSWIDFDGYAPIEPQIITVSSEAEQSLSVQTLPNEQGQTSVRVTILNVDENDEPLVHSCFQIYEEGVDIFAVAPIADLCDAQDDEVDAQVTFDLEPGTYILHQSWVDFEGYVAAEPQTISVGTESEQMLTVQTLPEVDGDSGTGTATYESPNYGYVLNYDEETWTVLFEDGDPSDPYDEIYLYNNVSIVGLTADPDYELSELSNCVDDYVQGMQQQDGNSNIAPLSDPDAARSTDDAVWATFTYVYTGDTGEASDWVRYIECRATDDDLTLVITQDVPANDFDDEVGDRKDLLDGLVIP